MGYINPAILGSRYGEETNGLNKWCHLGSLQMRNKSKGLHINCFLCIRD